jgi:cellulose synthase/poly-beta-1,6-N-acetylglucosamine synthase-like glycosyltransferase
MWSHIAFWLAVLTLAGFLFTFLELAFASGKMPRLLDEPAELVDAPLVSVLVAARDEERGIADALQSLLRLDYPRYEIIAVDDRSTDRTGPILDALAAQSKGTLRVVHVTELPDGWLGKNHAHAEAARAAAGELLLFTDADIVFQPTVLSRAVHLMQRNRLDHLALGPDVGSRGSLLLAATVNYFAFCFAIFMKPWKAIDPKSRRHVGIGAFNLVRADAYRRVGGHEPIRMRPDDDIKLGKILKQSGARQQIAAGNGLLSVDWYHSVGEFVQGLQKNTFASLDYNTPLTIAAIAFTFLTHLWPYVALVLTHGTTRLVNAAIVAVQLVTLAAVSWAAERRPWLALGYPIAAAIFLYTVASATFRTLRNDGIDWRGTHYPLARLRANRV